MLANLIRTMVVSDCETSPCCGANSDDCDCAECQEFYGEDIVLDPESCGPFDDILLRWIDDRELARIVEYSTD